jgi:hypothetical protein
MGYCDSLMRFVFVSRYVRLGTRKWNVRNNTWGSDASALHRATMKSPVQSRLDTTCKPSTSTQRSKSRWRGTGQILPLVFTAIVTVYCRVALCLWDSKCWPLSLGSSGSCSDAERQSLQRADESRFHAYRPQQGTE